MIRRLHSRSGWLACALLAAASSTAAEPAATAQPAAAPPARALEQSERISRRIDALLKRRLNPDPLPQLLPNPFAAASANVASVRGEGSDPGAPNDGGAATSTAPSAVAQAPGPPPAASAADILARCAAELKIGGVIEQRGELQVIVNGVPRKEGDFVILMQDKAAVRLQILHIQPRGMVVRLNGVEQTVRF